MKIVLTKLSTEVFKGDKDERLLLIFVNIAN